MEAIVEKLKELRKQMGKTQADIARYLGISYPAYAHYESGRRDPDPHSLNKLADYFGVSVDYLLGRKEPDPSKGKRINVYGEIAAGIPIEAVEDIVDLEEISPDMAARGEYIALRIKGSSMEPRIMDGDVVIIRLQDDVQNGEIAAVFVNGDSATLKRIKKEKGGLWLISLNQAYSPMFYSQRECQELPIRILGKMVELRAKF